MCFYILYVSVVIDKTSVNVAFSRGSLTANCMWSSGDVITFIAAPAHLIMLIVK